MNNDMIPISINKEGEWFYGGVKMFRLNIVSLFAQHLEKSGDSYFIKYQDQVYPVTVADTPFYAQTILKAQDNDFSVRLADGRTENVPASTIILDKDIPYGSLKWSNDIKFSRQALWDLSEYFTEEKNGAVTLKLNGKNYPISSQ